MRRPFGIAPTTFIKDLAAIDISSKMLRATLLGISSAGLLTHTDSLLFLFHIINGFLILRNYFLFNMELSMKRTTLLCFALLSLLAACDTIAGAGQDISHGGQDISHAAHND
jgi:predicted small secreted protein